MKTKNRTSRSTAFDDMPTDYEGLCRDVFLPRPLHDRQMYEAALEAVETMWGAEGRMTSGQDDWFGMVTDVIAAYEEEHEQRPPRPKAGQALRYLVEDACGWSGADLARFLGLHPTMGAKILRGERQLTVEHIRKLAKKLKVSADLLI